MLAGVLLAVGIYLIATSRTRRPFLAELLRPLQVRTVGDEAQEWLQER